jgi:hypothetical protein
MELASGDTDSVDYLRRRFQRRHCETNKENLTMKNYINQHWRGEQSLPRSYWLNYFLLVAGTGAVFSVASAVQFFAQYFAIAYLAVFVWGVVGAFRAASKRGGFWGVVAQIVLALAALQFAVGFVQGVVKTVSGAPGTSI